MSSEFVADCRLTWLDCWLIGGVVLAFHRNGDTVEIRVQGDGEGLFVKENHPSESGFVSEPSAKDE